MNSLADILSDKADDLFLGEAPQTATAPGPVDKTAELKRMVYAMKDQLDGMLRLIDGDSISFAAPKTTLHTANGDAGRERVLEGAFTGEKMRGDDDKDYAVPPNYASKSKLVAGDRMKLTITKSGSFIFKQIGPVERRRDIGELTGDPINNQWAVLVGEKLYRILTASVTFYKGKPDDEVIILLPRSGESSWGAVDNIISK